MHDRTRRALQRACFGGGVRFVSTPGRRSRRVQPGTMRERSPGHWQLRAYVGRDPVTGKPRQVTRTFKGGERAAAKALAALVAEVETGKFSRTTATVSQLLDKWLEAGEWSQRPRTLYENRRKIDGRIRPILGHIQLAELEPDVIDAAYRRWLDDGLSPATVHKYHCILSAACRQAVKWGWIDDCSDSPLDTAEGGADGDEGSDAGAGVRSDQGCRGQRSGSRHRRGSRCAHRSTSGRAGSAQME